jgi:DNA primase
MLDFVSYCRKALLTDQAALRYLTQERHVSMASVEAFGLGFCPSNPDFDMRGRRELDALRGRITVPIYSEFGRLVCIAGRVPDPKVKGWWNTQFVKSSHLYGFNHARQHIFMRNKGYVFEGYLDRIILAQCGLPNSVAVMSADLGMRRVGLLARYCDRLCLCFDTDANDAGLLGLLKSLEQLYSVGFGTNPALDAQDGMMSPSLSMIRLPVGVDPDEFVMKEGLDAFLSLEKPLSIQQLKAAGAAVEALKERMRLKRRNAS